MAAKKELKIAKLMFKQSLTGGTVDTRKVGTVLKAVSSQKLAHPTSVLKIYKRLIQIALKKEEVVVESASRLTNQAKFEKELKQKTGALRVKYKINPDFVLGTRITHGDWIYDETLDEKLNQLTTIA